MAEKLASSLRSLSELRSDRPGSRDEWQGRPKGNTRSSTLFGFDAARLSDPRSEVVDRHDVRGRKAASGRDTRPGSEENMSRPSSAPARGPVKRPAHPSPFKNGIR